MLIVYLKVSPCEYSSFRICPQISGLNYFKNCWAIIVQTFPRRIEAISRQDFTEKWDRIWQGWQFAAPRISSWNDMKCSHCSFFSVGFVSWPLYFLSTSFLSFNICWLLNGIIWSSQGVRAAFEHTQLLFPTAAWVRSGIGLWCCEFSKQCFGL